MPFLWGFHAVHHSAKAMDWLAGARMHFVEIVLLRGVTSLPLFTLGFCASVMQAYIALVYVYSSLLHANLRGDFDRLGHWMATPRFHHWHHGLEEEAIDVNFAIHFPLLDKLFGTFHLPEGPLAEGLRRAARRCRRAIGSRSTIRSCAARRRSTRRRWSDDGGVLALLNYSPARLSNAAGCRSGRPAPRASPRPRGRDTSFLRRRCVAHSG